MIQPRRGSPKVHDEENIVGQERCQMKEVSLLAVVDADKCNGCKICESVCPVLAVTRENRKAVVEEARCSGCGACEQRCPTYAVTLVKRDQPFVVKADVGAVDYEQVKAVCRIARLNPEQLVCYCTATRAEEVAAAILQGADSPEEISHRTGKRPKGWQWYARTVTAWEIPPEIREKYSSRGFYFDEDLKLLNAIAAAPLQGRSVK
jgi:Pyruvate/2-oxoacid:ferredoxin oxidoreductase delta subunit